MTAEFKLSARDPDSLQSSSDEFLEASASVACRGFAGESRFAVAWRDLASFAEELRALREAKRDTAQLLGGWDTVEERLRLRVTPAGLSGQFCARIHIAQTGPRSDQWNRVDTEFICSPDALSAFLTELDELIVQRSRTQPRLFGDPGAIA